MRSSFIAIFLVAAGALAACKVKDPPPITDDEWKDTYERGDIKVEVFGDGKSFDPDGGRYMATGYEVIFGGWFNSKSIIARLDEHGKDVVENTAIKVEPTRRYHWRIERIGKKLSWYVDDKI